MFLARISSAIPLAKAYYSRNLSDGFTRQIYCYIYSCNIGLFGDQDDLEGAVHLSAIFFIRTISSALREVASFTRSPTIRSSPSASVC